MRSNEHKSSIPITGKLDDRVNVFKEPKPFEELPEDVQRFLVDKRNNSKERSALQKLESKHMLSILVYIDSMSPVVKSDIYNNISRCSNMSEKLTDLYGMGLIDIYKTAYANTNVVIITEKGHQVVGYIKQIAEILGGSDIGERGGGQGIVMMFWAFTIGWSEILFRT